MKMKKKILALLLALCMVIGLAACGGSGDKPSESPSAAPSASEPAAPSDAAPAEPNGDVAKEITLWTYPVGNWGLEDVVKPIIDAFTAETGIKVDVQYLSYTDGDDKVNTALTAGGAPDLVLEGPDRLVANWGANGYMVDLSDMIDDTDKQEINADILATCTSADGSVYEYPMTMTTHCMAINKQAFEEAGALQYVNLDTHTWTTEQFKQAVAALYAKYNGTVGAMYCNGQGGDQGTRALVDNIAGETFMSGDLSACTWNTPAKTAAIEMLRDLDGIAIDASINASDEIALFYQGVLKIGFCWNVAQQLNPNSADTGAAKNMNGDDIICMSFPSEDGTPVLEGGVWGLGVFKNEDASRVAAAKEFVKFVCDSAHTADCVKAANFFPVRTAAEGTDLSKTWEGNDIMNEYQALFTQYQGPIYSIAPKWAQIRTAWWNMLQAVGAGTDVATALADGEAAANA